MSASCHGDAVVHISKLPVRRRAVSEGHHRAAHQVLPVRRVLSVAVDMIAAFFLPSGAARA